LPQLHPERRGLGKAGKEESHKLYSFWDDFFMPFNYPAITKHCRETCGMETPDAQKSKCTRCSFFKATRKEGWVWG